MTERIVILGTGSSGMGAAQLAQAQGWNVKVSDAGCIAESKKQWLRTQNIAFEEEGHTWAFIQGAALVVKSPGIVPELPILNQIRQHGIPVISEIEFAARYTRSPIVAVTGTNGKSTTSALIHFILQKAGLDVALVGNIGWSFSEQVCRHDAAYYVVEVSSFQLEDCYSFRPRIAVITNITPNHLDRYGYDMNRYADAKMRITQAQSDVDQFIYCFDDYETRRALERQRVVAQQYPFSHSHVLPHGAWLRGEDIIFSSPKQTFTMPTQHLGLRGRHNVYNSMAAGIAASLLDLSDELIREALRDFKGLEHRLEWVADIKGTEFINDSKATSVNATWFALECVTKPIIWIAGGIDKGNDYSILIDLVRKKVKALVCLGVDNRKLHEAFSSSVDLIVNTSSMREAVHAAFHLSAPGDCVLLSPACASFDLFENFEDRGRQFKEAVRSL